MKSIKILIILILITFLNLEANEKKLSLNLVNMSISNLIKLTSKILDTNILVNYDIKGKFDMVSSKPIKENELLNILISTLESKGFTLVKNGSMLEVVRIADSSKGHIGLLNQNNKATGNILITQTIPVLNENVDVVASKIKYLISKSGKLMTFKETNTILITDYPRNIEIIKKIVKELVKSKKLKVIPILIKEANAKDIEKKLKLLTKNLFNKNIKNNNIDIILDEQLNTIFLVGSEKNILIVKNLIKELDKPLKIDNTITIFNLKNTEAKTILKSLNDILDNQQFKDKDSKPNLTMNEEINSIIAIGDKKNIKAIKYIIDELDKEKYQVYVKARIIELNKNNSEALGIKYGFDGASLTSNGLYSFSSNFGGSSVTGLVGNALVSGLDPATISSGIALGAALDFLEENGAGRTISNPSILCINNKKSSIYVGKTISISTGSVQSADLGSGLTQTYTRTNIGLTLEIKPRVSSDNKVTLEVVSILENVLDDGSGTTDGQPVTSKQEIKTEAILRDGEHIIIGGLVKKYDKTSTTKVPFLGDIPIIGNLLFTSNSISTEEDNLIIILTPYIIKNSDELSKLQKDLGEVEQLERKYKLIFEKKNVKEEVEKNSFDIENSDDDEDF
jgi:general secretion pathway protein D